MDIIQIKQKIKSSEFVYMKVSVNTFLPWKAVLEITSSTLNLIESETFEYQEGAIEKAQLAMLQKAGAYENKGVYVIINPFTN